MMHLVVPLQLRAPPESAPVARRVRKVPGAWVGSHEEHCLRGKPGFRSTHRKDHKFVYRETLWRLKYRMYRLHTAKMGTKSMEVVASLCCCPRCSSTLYKVILPEILHLRNSQQHPKTKEGEVRRFTIDRYACQDTSAYIHLLSSSILSIH